ncbi:uncharacterized protein [Procambarus clarkii]|uniref:uncharacterized protein isoform X2 n=1 Tax=Procambarus clarkii TaxID=6728 RepID=UPI003742647B
MAGVPSQAMRLQLVCLLLCQALRLYSAEFTHDRKRLGPLESVRAEHGCLEKFEVSESTIIRTQDSRVLGAKFLNESDVGNREDCLTLCCATHLCNVAVFEEKGSGSCYLFDCGPPGDFKCKFTGHTFYTSAVLKVNRHQLELGLWSEQSQHEAELANLRSSGEVDDSMGAPDMRHAVPTTVPTPPPKVTIPTTTTTTTSTTVTPAAPTTTTTTTTAKTTLPPRKCSRFQFECHSGECIAIYNACDGIPQCQDNSDEDPALGCPPASTEGVVAAARRPGDETGGGDQGQTAGTTWDNPGPAKNDLSSSGDVWQGASRYPNSGYPPGIFSRRPNILDTYSPYQPSGGPQDDSQVYGGRSRAPSGYYDYNQRSAWAGPMYNGGDVGGRGDHYMGADGHRAFHYPDYGQPQQQPQQQQQQQLLPPMQQPQISNNPVWMDKPNYPIQQSQQQLHQQIQDLHQTPSVMQHQQLQQQQLQQQQQVVGQQPAGPYQLPPTLEHQHNAASIQANIQGVQMDMTGGTSRQIPANSEVLPPMPKTSTSTMAPLVTPSTGMTTTNGTNSSAGVKEITAPMGSYAQAPAHAAHDPINTVAHASLARLEVNLEELEMQAREQDAQASGAVLALAMGVCITALLVVLVGCRLRGVRRRLRRHRGARSPYAHDADYLVNGMYL